MQVDPGLTPDVSGYRFRCIRVKGHIRTGIGSLHGFRVRCGGAGRLYQPHGDPIKPKSKSPGTERLKLKYDKLLSRLAFKLRRYGEVFDYHAERVFGYMQAGHSLVHFSAQPEPFQSLKQPHESHQKCSA